MELKKTEAQTLERLLNTKSKDAVLVALNNETPQLSRLRLDLGITELGALIAELITHCVSQFNIARNMTDEQIAVCAIDIIDSFPFLNLFDIQQCFKKAEAGFYGKIYHGIDKLVIFEWLFTYEKDKSEMIIAHRERENKNMNIKQPLLALAKIEIGKSPEITIKPIEENPYQKYFKEFDELHKRSDTTSSGIRYVELDGKLMNQEEFVLYKFEQYKNNGNKG